MANHFQSNGGSWGSTADPPTPRLDGSLQHGEFMGFTNQNDTPDQFLLGSTLDQDFGHQWEHVTQSEATSRLPAAFPFASASMLPSFSPDETLKHPKTLLTIRPSDENATALRPSVHTAPPQPKPLLRAPLRAHKTDPLPRQHGHPGSSFNIIFRGDEGISPKCLTLPTTFDQAPTTPYHIPQPPVEGHPAHTAAILTQGDSDSDSPASNFKSCISEDPQIERRTRKRARRQKQLKQSTQHMDLRDQPGHALVSTSTAIDDAAASLIRSFVRLYPTTFFFPDKLKAIATVTSLPPNSVQWLISKILEETLPTPSHNTESSLATTHSGSTSQFRSIMITDRSISPYDSHQRIRQELPDVQPILKHAAEYLKDGGAWRCSPKKERDHLIRDHTKIYQCTFKCGARFPRKSELERHEEEKNYPREGWVCEVELAVPVSGVQTCGYCEEQNPTEDHAMAAHKNRLPFCHLKSVETRGKVFSRKTRLQEHFKKVHPSIPIVGYLNKSHFEVNSTLPQWCGFCRKLGDFRGSKDRVDHMETHFKDGLDMLSWIDLPMLSENIGVDGDTDSDTGGDADEGGDEDIEETEDEDKSHDNIDNKSQSERSGNNQDNSTFDAPTSTWAQPNYTGCGDDLYTNSSTDYQINHMSLPRSDPSLHDLVSTRKMVPEMSPLKDLPIGIDELAISYVRDSNVDLHQTTQTDYKREENLVLDERTKGSHWNWLLKNLVARLLRKIRHASQTQRKSSKQENLPTSGQGIAALSQPKLPWTPLLESKSGRVDSGGSWSNTTISTLDFSPKVRFKAWLLKKQLRDARVRQKDHNFFIPVSEIRRLISPDTIHQELDATYSIHSLESRENYATIISSQAQKLFAILVFIGMECSVLDFIQEGITDADLPLGAGGDKDTQTLSSRFRGQVQAVTPWDSRDIEEFDRNQWSFLSPVFDKNGQHYTFDDRQVLPFIENNEGDLVQTVSGGYSDVWGVRIHRAHQTLYPTTSCIGKEPLIAIKRPHSISQENFEKESRVLQEITRINHPHLVQLLATYHHHGRYHLMFPYADSNLRGFWQRLPNPDFTKESVLWSLVQMRGLASGLDAIHNFTPKNYTAESKDYLAPFGSEMRFGRHGDIKPENILWFAGHGEGPGGILQIADFGLSGFHGRESRSNVDPRSIVSTPTYEAPELALQESISRAYDIWGLGCVFLEFIVWILGGAVGLEAFADVRLLVTPDGNSCDNFYAIVQDPSGNMTASVPNQILKWIENLNNHERSSPCMRDLLHLIKDHILIINSKKRISSRDLLTRLSLILESAVKDERYLLGPISQHKLDVLRQRVAPPQFPETEQTRLESAAPIQKAQIETSQPIHHMQVQTEGPTSAPVIQEMLIATTLHETSGSAPNPLTYTLAPTPVHGGNSNRESRGGLSPGWPLAVRQSSSASFKSKNSIDGNSLRDEIRRARIECHGRAHSYFIPICKLKELITVANIEQDIRDRDNNIEDAEIKRVAQEAFVVAPKVFATLVLMDKGLDIYGLLRDGISDKDLPLKGMTKDGVFILGRGSGVPIDTFEHWGEEEREEFHRMQLWMTVPVFQRNEYHELEECTILPFVHFERNAATENNREGGYGEVFPIRIHPSHHNFWEPSQSLDREPLVAIKRLFSSDKSGFEKEQQILKALGSQGRKDLHLITLLATFRHRGKYHLIFPWADANLRKYWWDRPSPSFDEATVLWCIKQMTGIVCSLDSIHNFTITYPLCIDDPSQVGEYDDFRLGIEKPEELYGRHGDIKAENILWFTQSVESEDGMGVLQLADFGLGRFHGRHSRSGVDPCGVQSSPPYEPPECKLHRPISRAYDIWSLGCLYLEFISWLLKGSAQIDNISSEDSFFRIINNGSDAIVREGVVDWVQQLHSHEKCSAFIHDLLDLIMQDVLIPDSKQRIPAATLWEKLKELLGKAMEDKVYLVKPTPRKMKVGSY